MHPDPLFHLDDDAARALVRDVAFAHIFIDGPARPAVIHAPVLLEEGDRLVFHLSRRNRAMPIAPATRAIASIGAPGTYISPDWYVGPHQVPTWNYVAVEAEGIVTLADDATLVAHLDAMSHVQEARLAPKPEWTRAKMEQARFNAMAKGIVCAVLTVEAWRGTAKLSQNKPLADVDGVIAGLRGIGRDHHADLVERANDKRRG